MDAQVHESRTEDGARLRLVIEHPPGNILSLSVVAGLRRALASLAPSGPLKLLTIEGEGADFSFGASIDEHRPAAIGRVLPETHGLIRDLLAAPVATAACVKGRCLGGGFELAMACDFIFAADEARFGLPEIALGVFPPAAAALLGARVGAARATAAMITGELQSAAHWRDAGLVSWTTPAASLDEAVEEWYRTHLRLRSAEALRYAVMAARLATREQVERTLAEAETLYLDRLMRSSDAVEGVAAFLDKRAPRWTDS